MYVASVSHNIKMQYVFNIFLLSSLNHIQISRCNTIQICIFFYCRFSVANSPGGCAYEREVTPPDWVLDYWHPLEKAQYPEYFARREERKKEYVIWWEKQYGKPAQIDKGHLETILR